MYVVWKGSGADWRMALLALGVPCQQVPRPEEGPPRIDWGVGHTPPTLLHPQSTVGPRDPSAAPDHSGSETLSKCGSSAGWLPSRLRRQEEGVDWPR